MNNIYNTANKLAKEIQESSEYKNYKKAREVVLSNPDLKKKIDKYLGLVDARLYDVLMVDEKSFKKARKIILKTKFDEVKVALKEVPFAQVLDL